jgi:hypothetical protein
MVVLCGIPLGVDLTFLAVGPLSGLKEHRSRHVLG